MGSGYFYGGRKEERELWDGGSLYPKTLRLQIQQWKSGTHLASKPVNQWLRGRWKRCHQLIKKKKVLQLLCSSGSQRNPCTSKQTDSRTQAQRLWPSKSEWGLGVLLSQASHVVLRPFPEKPCSRVLMNPGNKYMKYHSLPS